jgi:hypothetical protein
MHAPTALSKLPKMDHVLGAAALADAGWRRDIVSESSPMR